MSRTIAGIVVSVMLAATAGCSPPPASAGGFDSRDPGAKLYAIQHAGEQRDRSAIPKLIEQLNSDDGAVRMYAIMALEKITGTRLGYSPFDPAWKRQPEIDKWIAAYQAGQFAQDAKPDASHATGDGETKP